MKSENKYRSQQHGELSERGHRREWISIATLHWQQRSVGIMLHFVFNLELRAAGKQWEIVEADEMYGISCQSLSQLGILITNDQERGRKLLQALHVRDCQSEWS
jgi:hypothetical protein